MIKERLSRLRKIMKSEGIDAYIISGCDPHQSEYTAGRWATRRWITGFTGSAGLVVVTMDKAGLWTDSRYYIQAEEELEDTGITLFKTGLSGVPGYLKWIVSALSPGSVVGSNVWTTSVAGSKEIISGLNGSGLVYKGCRDLLNDIWADRPDFPCKSVYQVDPEYTGKGRIEKISDIREWMKGEKLSWHIISSLADIAWSLNLRGSDIKFNPLFISYLLIGEESVYLYINSGQLSGELEILLGKDGVGIEQYGKINEHILTLSPGVINLPPETTSTGIEKLFTPEWDLVYRKDITPKMKAVKNISEIRALGNVMRKDGIAMVRFMIWLEANWPAGNLTELTVGNKAAEFRSLQAGFIGLSSGTIAGFGDHGVLNHYSATEESAYTLTVPGVLLLDSGGQYVDGTTDITRVFISGEPEEDLIHDYTLVLKGHIDLALAVFPQGTKGVQLDILARKALWDEGKNYGHGTGHGVGFFLNVHEGPQSISTKVINVDIEEGMLISNEPGLYIENRYGIRIENLILTVKSSIGSSEEFLAFRTVSLCPLELDLIDVNLLTSLQREWVNDYHSQVYNELAPFLTEIEKKWLRVRTRRI